MLILVCVRVEGCLYDLLVYLVVLSQLYRLNIEM